MQLQAKTLYVRLCTVSSLSVYTSMSKWLSHGFLHVDMQC